MFFEKLISITASLLVGVGYQLKDSIKEASTSYPEQKFALMDETYEEIPGNVVPVVFKEEEAAYLTGIIASKMTKTKNVGFIGGLPAPSVVKYQYGYKYGVESTNKEIKVSEQYANSFSDQAKGKSIAKQMHASNVDIILSAAGDAGTGAIEAARENNKFAIGVDRDQSDLAKELVEGSYKGGEEKVYGLKKGAVGIPGNANKNVPQDIIDFVNKEAEKVIKGEIKVPRNEEEYNKLMK